MESHSPQVDFQTWSNRLHPAPIHARVALGTGTSSTSVNHTRVPVSVSRWHQFPEWVAMWKAEIMEKDLGGAQFEVLAKAHTRHYTVGALLPEVIRDEQSSRRTLEHFYSMVNHFHLDFHGALYPCLQQPRENTEVYANAGSVVQVRSNPDIVITDGTDNMLKVGLGEVRSPWILTRRSIVHFMSRLPFTHFGEQFVGVEGQTEEILYTGKAITQLYNNLLTDRLSVGFVATPEAIIYCFIPPDNRTCLQIHYSPIWREIMDLVPPRFTPQVGLATLAWFAKTHFGGKKLMAPKNMRKWGNFILALMLTFFQATIPLQRGVRVNRKVSIT